mgnify:CR=1 FL=1
MWTLGAEALSAAGTSRATLPLTWPLSSAATHATLHLPVGKFGGKLQQLLAAQFSVSVSIKLHGVFDHAIGIWTLSHALPLRSSLWTACLGSAESLTVLSRPAWWAKLSWRTLWRSKAFAALSRWPKALASWRRAKLARSARRSEALWSARAELTTRTIRWTVSWSTLWSEFILRQLSIRVLVERA